MIMQQPPESGVALIKEYEGCAEAIGNGIYRAYPDPATGGEPFTIGWGTTKNEYNEPIKQGDTATQEEVDRYLLSECDAGMIILADTIPFWLEMDDDQQGALLSFAYNLGWHFYGNVRSFLHHLLPAICYRTATGVPWCPRCPDALRQRRRSCHAWPCSYDDMDEAEPLASKPQLPLSTPITPCTSHGYLHP